VSNLVDLLPIATTLRCVCGVSLRLAAGRLVDGAGSDRCVSGAAHSPQIAPSPTGGWLRG
jgi:hypothetical protein